MGETPGQFNALNNGENQRNKTCVVPCQQGGVGRSRSLVPCTPYESPTGEGMYVKVLKGNKQLQEKKYILHTSHQSSSYQNNYHYCIFRKSIATF
jgi:hypothetical protein